MTESAYKPLADLEARAEEIARVSAPQPAYRAVLDRAIAAIDRDQWDAIKAKYAAELAGPDARGAFKYADLPFWMADRTAIAFRIGLESKPPLAILDLGMGGGHFGAVAQAVGHRVVGIDSYEPLHEDLCALFGVERRLSPISARVPLPSLGERFDLVTMIGPAFDRPSDGTATVPWTLDDWLFLLRDLADNHLTPGGSILIQLDPEELRRNPELVAWATARGAGEDAGAGVLRFDGVASGAFFAGDGEGEPAPRESRYKPLMDLDARTAEVAARIGSRRRREIFDKAMATIDRPAWAALQRKYAPELTDYDEIGVFKYADAPFWVAHKAEVALRFGFDRMPPSSVLDIGMGAGQFGLVLRSMGHRVAGTDIAEPLYDDSCALFGLARHHVPVVRAEPMPSLGERFDVITIVWQIFDIEWVRINRKTHKVYWTLEDWLFLLRDLTDNHLNPGGSILIELNQQILPEGDRYDPDLMAWAAARGAVLRAESGHLAFRRLKPGGNFFTVNGRIPRKRWNPRALLRRIIGAFS